MEDAPKLLRLPASDTRWFDADLPCTVGLINLQQADGIHRSRPSADKKRWMAFVALLKVHTIIKAGRLRAERRTNHRITIEPTLHLTPTDRHQLPRTFAYRHHVHTTVANQSGELVLKNHFAKVRGRRMSLNGLFARTTPGTRTGDETGRGSVWKTPHCTRPRSLCRKFSPLLC